MGFVLNVDLETSEGPSHEVYTRIESLSYNKVTSEVRFQLTYWLDRDHAIRFNRTYLSEKIKNAIGLVQERVLYFEDEMSDGKEVLLPNHLRTPLVSVKEIEVPLYEVQEIETDAPYVSFDEEGEEVIKYRKVVKEEKIRVGVSRKTAEVIDSSLARDLYGFCYGHAQKELSKWLPEDKIETVK
jgi:hypothetical protein